VYELHNRADSPSYSLGASWVSAHGKGTSDLRQNCFVSLYFWHLACPNLA
jgi:hypothetical protein